MHLLWYVSCCYSNQFSIAPSHSKRCFFLRVEGVSSVRGEAGGLQDRGVYTYLWFLQNQTAEPERWNPCVRQTEHQTWSSRARGKHLRCVSVCEDQSFSQTLKLTWLIKMLMFLDRINMNQQNGPIRQTPLLLYRRAPDPAPDQHVMILRKLKHI